jgi:hypothetical protein
VIDRDEMHLGLGVYVTLIGLFAFGDATRELTQLLELAFAEHVAGSQVLSVLRDASHDLVTERGHEPSELGEARLELHIVDARQLARDEHALGALPVEGFARGRGGKGSGAGSHRGVLIAPSAPKCSHD